MRTFPASLTLLCVGVLVATARFADAAPEAVAGGDAPIANNGKPWRVAYCESGEFVNYAGTLNGLVRGLAEKGWLDAGGLPYVDGQKDTRGMWEWLAAGAHGAFLEFVPDAFYRLDRAEGTSSVVAKELLNRLSESQDIDLLIVMGTQAGQLLATDAHRTPTLIFSTSNAVQAGILIRDTDSGRDHVWGHVDPRRYRRQIEMSHDLFAFKKLGMVYEDTPDGRMYAGVDEIEAVAKERGFAVVHEHVKDRQGDRARHREETLVANKRLVEEGVDAVYCTLYFDRNPDDLGLAFQPFYESRVPVFSQQGAAEVRRGALLSVARADFTGIGRFGARVISGIFHGEKPRSLPQVFENTPNIVLNMAVADKIQFAPPFEIYLVADEVYHVIEPVR